MPITKQKMRTIAKEMESLCKEYQLVELAVDSSRETSKELSGITWTDQQATEHVRFMCRKIHEFVDDGRLGKANRWIGCAQGILCATGIASINDFRKMNMPEDEDFRG